jgi:hypothetical protein
MTPEVFVRLELLNNPGLTVVDLVGRKPEGITGDSVRVAVLHLLNSGEVDVDINHKLSLTREVKS